MVCARCGGGLARDTRSHGRVHWRFQDCGQSVALSDEALAEMVDRRLRVNPVIDERFVIQWEQTSRVE